MTELFRAVREGKKEGGRYLNWLAHEPQIHYIVVWSPEGYVGEYTLIVETVLRPQGRRSCQWQELPRSLCTPEKSISPLLGWST